MSSVDDVAILKQEEQISGGCFDLDLQRIKGTFLAAVLGDCSPAPRNILLKCLDLGGVWRGHVSQSVE